MEKSIMVLFALMMVFLPGCKKGPVEAKCGDSIRSLKVTDSSFAVKCPADCAFGAVWGTDTYTVDSSLCLSAIHAGVITRAGGMVSVEVKPGLPAYKGSERNGVKSSGWGSFDGSFVVKK